MTLVLRTLLAASLLPLAISACFLKSDRRSDAHLAPDRVTELARLAFAPRATEGTSYSSDDPEYVADKKVWWVFFHDGEWSLDPRRDFVVVVDDRTEKTCVASAAERGACAEAAQGFTH